MKQLNHLIRGCSVLLCLLLAGCNSQTPHTEQDSVRSKETAETEPATMSATTETEPEPEPETETLSDVERYADILLDLEEANRVDVLAEHGAVSANYTFYDANGEETGSATDSYSGGDAPFFWYWEEGYVKYASGQLSYQARNGEDVSGAEVVCYLRDQAETQLESMHYLYYTYNEDELLLDCTDREGTLSIQTEAPVAGMEHAKIKTTYAVDAQSLRIISYRSEVIRDESCLMRYDCKIVVQDSPLEVPIFITELESEETKICTVVVDPGTPEEMTEQFTVPRRCAVTAAVYDGYLLYADSAGEESVLQAVSGREDLTLYMLPDAEQAESETNQP